MFFSNLKVAPTDPILGLVDVYLNDKNPKKVNLSIGIYGDDDEKITLLKSVEIAEQRIVAAKENKNYLAITGLENFNAETQKLLLGENHPLIKDKKIYTAQTIGSSAALRISAEFLYHQIGKRKIWVSDPTWGNHIAIFSHVGLEVLKYRYYDEKTKGLDWEGFTEDLKALESGSVVLLHGCCHNPTGVDPTPAQWDALAEIFKEKDLIPVFDIAYQGFAHSLEEDVYGLRKFAEVLDEMLICNSYSKIFGLYGERVGALSIVTANSDDCYAAYTQIRNLIRILYSNPAKHGAEIVSLILSDPALKKLWISEVEEMCVRIKQMRIALVNSLQEKAVDFSFVNSQQGMFSYTGLTKANVDDLIADYAVYAIASGRVNIAGLTTKNVEYVAEAIAKVLNK